MACFKVERNRRGAGGFWLMAPLAAFLSFPLILSVLQFQRSGGDNLLLTLFSVLIFGWLAGSLWIYALQFRRLRSQGLLFEIDSDGVTDHWGGAPKRLGWRDMRRIDWKDTGAGPVVEFVLEAVSIGSFIRSAFGFRRFLYPVRYGSASVKDIHAALLEAAPEDLYR